ncbi:hypothetical protein ACL02S_23865 [Nocardia sp. 004]|uniref:hypothetical protein n=1 Tax=Nocardia sp. 004 TaxID=3385978 RepID=UPI0039A2844C
MIDTITQPVLPDWGQMLAACWGSANNDDSDMHPIVKAVTKLATIGQNDNCRAELISEINSWVIDWVPGLDTLGDTVSEFTNYIVAARIHVEADHASELDMEKLANAWTQVVAEVEAFRATLLRSRQRQSATVR